MMALNRDVVLECPQLDIPWFHETYCKENATEGKYAHLYDRRSCMLIELCPLRGFEKFSLS